jgi:hypothetical protein
MDYETYYAKGEILFEMVKLMKGREVVFLGEDGAVRNIKAHNLGYLQSNMNAFNFFNKRYNLYISVAAYNNLPLMSYDPMQRSDQRKAFNDNFQDYLIDYDFFMDFDAKDFDHIKDAQSDCIIIHNILKDNGIYHNIMFSGNKGFHLVVPGQYIDMKIDKRISCFKRLVARLCLIYNLKTPDKTVYDYRRIRKVPYSMDIKSGKIVLPLDDAQLHGFNADVVTPELYDFSRFRNRGLINLGGQNKLDVLINKLVL